jgi:hypothetical protein
VKVSYFNPVCRLFLAIGLLVSVCGRSAAQQTTNQPPQVSIVSPTNGATFAAPANILVSANVTIGDQWTRFVSLYDGTNRLAYLLLDPLPVTNGYVLPLTIPWDNVPAGSHTLTMVVTDTSFTSATSAPVSITVTGWFPVVTIVATDPLASESGDTGTFTLYRIGNTNSALNVYYTIGGTASNGVDYAKIPNIISIPAGISSKQITVTPMGDPLVQGDQTVILHLTTDSPFEFPINYEIGKPDTATVVIQDDDGSNQPPVVSIVSPLDGAVFPAPANIFILANAMDPNGYMTITTVEFFEGTNSLGITTNYPVLNPIGPFHVYWTNVAAGNYTLTAVATDNQGATGASAPVNITVISPTNPVPIVTIVATDPLASESGDTGTFTLYRFGNTNSALQVYYTIGGTASNGVDYATIPNIVSIPAGISSTQITVSPKGDPLVQGDETVVLHLAPSPFEMPITQYYEIGKPDTATVVIKDDDATNQPPVVSIVATDPIAVEGTNFISFWPPTIFTNFWSGTNTATFLVRRAGDTNSDLTVQYGIGGTATNGVDYAALPGSVVIPAGKRFALIPVVPLKDADHLFRSYDTVVLSLKSPTNTPPPYFVGWPGKAGAVILEDRDLLRPFPAFMPDGCFRAAWPGANGLNFCLQLSTNLTDWIPVCTNTVVKGSIQFVDPEAGTLANRYYRAVPVTTLPFY